MTKQIQMVLYLLKKPQYYDFETDLEIDDTDNNHHVLYDVQNEKYLDSVNTVGYKYQAQDRDEHDFFMSKLYINVLFWT